MRNKNDAAKLKKLKASLKAGNTVRQAAKDSGYDRTAVYKAAHTDPELYELIHGAVPDSYAAEALMVLGQLMHDDEAPASARVNASKAYIKLAAEMESGRKGPKANKPPAPGPATPEAFDIDGLCGLT